LREVVGATEAAFAAPPPGPANSPYGHKSSHDGGARQHGWGGDENGAAAGQRAPFAHAKESGGSSSTTSTTSWASPYATEGTAAVFDEALQPLERALLKLNVEKANLGGERDRLASRAAGNRSAASKSTKERQRLRDVEQRLGDLDRDAQQLRNRIRSATPLERAR
jgi:hypothetical protein